MAIFVHFLAALSMQGSLGSIAFIDPAKSKILIETKGPSGIEAKVLPDTGKPQAFQWKGEESVNGKQLTFNMMVASSDVTDENKKTIENEIKRRENEFEKEGGRTMVLERGGWKVRLTARFSYTGAAVFTESCTYPVLYYRTITAQSGAVDRAKSMLTNLVISDGVYAPQQMYQNGFPSGWTYEFSGQRVKVPFPVQWTTSTGLPAEDGFDGAVRYSYYQSTDAGSWAMSERIPTTQESIVDLAKRPLPRLADYSPLPRITKADIIDWSGQKLLRQVGVYGRGEFERDWMSLTSRDQHYRLHTVLLTKARNAVWPKTPFPIDAVGTPVVEGTWKRPPGLYERVADLGNGAKFTFTIWGESEPSEKDGVMTLSNSNFESSSLRYRQDGAKAFEEWVLSDGQLMPKKLVDIKAKIVDIQWKREGNSFWLKARQFGKGAKDEDMFRLIEVVGTEQGGQKFVLTMVGVDNDGFQRSFREVVKSCKGANGEPLFKAYPEGQVGEEYILPFHQSRMPLTIGTPIPAVAFGEGHVLTGGYHLQDQVRIFHSIEINKWGGKPHVTRVYEGVFAGQTLGKPKEIKFKKDGRNIFADRRTVKTLEGLDGFITTFHWGDGVYTHVLQTKGQPEDGWRKHLGLQ